MVSITKGYKNQNGRKNFAILNERVNFNNPKLKLYK